MCYYERIENVYIYLLQNDNITFFFYRIFAAVVCIFYIVVALSLNVHPSSQRTQLLPTNNKNNTLKTTSPCCYIYRKYSIYWCVCVCLSSALEFS